MDVAFHLKWGLGRQGRGFESGSWFLGGSGFESTYWFWGDLGLSVQLCFLGVVGLSPHLFWEGCGFESTSLSF